MTDNSSSDGATGIRISPLTALIPLMLLSGFLAAVNDGLEHWLAIAAAIATLVGVLRWRSWWMVLVTMVLMNLAFIAAGK